MNVEETRCMLERKLVHHCAPTLAGVKPSSLFNFVSLKKYAAYNLHEHLNTAVAACQAKIERGGASLSILLHRESSALVLLYRSAAIARVLAHSDSRAFLQEQGYDTSSPENCIESLRARFERYGCQQRANKQCESCEFPHEVGLLLGYPYEDVMGFIAHGGKNDICCGSWKVYSDADAARSTFDCFKKQTRIFEELFENGMTIEELALLGQTA